MTTAACPSPSAGGREDRCGLFAVPRRCTVRGCTAVDAVARPPDRPHQADAHYFTQPAALEDVHRSALRSLKTTGRPQAVHLHPAGEPCAAGECYLLRIGRP